MVSKEVKLWEVRFGDTVEKLTESISIDKDLYKNDIVSSREHASMLFLKGLITEDEKNGILKGLNEIEGQIERGKIVWRTDREDVHMNIEAAVTDLVGEPEWKLHAARSRNDQICTDFRHWCRDAIDSIVTSVKHLQLALKNEGLRLIVPAYTHLQRAQPVLLQHLCLAFVEQLARDAGRLLDCRKGMNFFALGACALAGTGLPVDRFMNSGALGFIAPMRNRPSEDNVEGASGGGRGLSSEDNVEGSSGGGRGLSSEDNDEGSGGRGRGGSGIWSRTLAGVGLVTGGVVGLYLVYKTHHAIEREIVGAIRDWKEAGFPALVNVKIEKVGFKFSIY
ncbi:argininosuccinate lyase, chloroplastic-like isoform X2 [Primulina huaijiensis]|uniref:argininosuccinate lyase, chloroplastic-like isoform X2 n=1 Tax=Primulina huaijiensis TaxID=1492673 RepID=UPI003CC6E563